MYVYVCEYACMFMCIYMCIIIKTCDKTSSTDTTTKQKHIHSAGSWNLISSAGESEQK